MTNIACRQWLAIAGLSLSALAPAAAQGQAESGPTVEVHIRTLKRDGGWGMRGFSDSMFVPGNPAAWTLTAGTDNPAEITVCGAGVGSGSTANRLRRGSFVWEIRVQPQKYDNGAATFDLDWKRFQSDAPDRPSAEGKATLTLRDGERQPIDFVHGNPGSRNCPEDAAFVEVAAGYKENPDLAGQLLQYDLWLKHAQANGETITRRFTAMGLQGADVDFAFAPLQFAVTAPAPAPEAFDVITTVQGTIKGRLQPNGRIAIIVDTSRRDGLGARGAGPSGGGGNGGRKVLEVAADEAVEIELPAPGGYSSRPAGRLGAAATTRGANPAPAPRKAVSNVDGRVVVDNGLFFQGQRTSVILQVKPVR